MAKTFKQSEETTWGPISRSFPSITADKSSEDPRLLVSKAGVKHTYIGLLEADVLEVLANYTFLPVSIAAAWLEEDAVSGLVSFDDEVVTGMEKIQSWIDLGLVFEETSINGSFIRPMKPVFLMNQMPVPQFTDIPYNLLNHTVGCAQAHFNILRGKFESLPAGLIPRWSAILGQKVDIGLNALPEARVRAFAYGTQVEKYLKNEFEIREAIKRKERVTPEFQDFWKFLIFSSKGEGLDPSDIKSYDIHIPDIIIPIPRDYTDVKLLKDSACSISVEVELTNKGKNRYLHTLEKYSNQNRFGSVLWLGSPSNIVTINSAARELSIDANSSPGIYFEEFATPKVSPLFS